MTTHEFTTLRDWFFMLLNIAILRRRDVVVFGSHAQERYWSRKYRLDAHKCPVIYNGMNVGHFDRTQLATSLSRE